MAIFQQKFERKTPIDDTERVNCLIETSQKVNGHTEYVLTIHRGPIKDNCWRLFRRYNDFVELHKCLDVSGVLLPLPEKKFFGNMKPDFIAKRRLALQEYINTILMNPILASSLPAKKFVDPETYNQSFHDLAVQNVVLLLRSEGGTYVIGPSLGAIGWRIRKHYFKVTLKNPNSKNQSSSMQSGSKHLLVKASSQSQSKQQQQVTTTVVTSPTNGCNDLNQLNEQTELTLTWTEFGPDKYICDKEIHNVFKYLAGLQHPHIQPIEYVNINDSGALVIRKFYAKGSVKDLLCGTTPKNPFLGKYGNPKGRSPIPLKDIAMWGRQILEAIKFLHSKGMPCGHLHAANVIIVDGSARLLDVENFVLGVPSFYRPFFVQHSKIYTSEMIDVYSFGHLLYEMAMGYPLQDSVSRSIECAPSLKNLLESILSKEACKVGLPTLEQLAEHQFFTEYAPKFTEQYSAAVTVTKPHLKLSTVAKEQIKIATQKTEQRLRDEQKSIKNQKRLVRVQEMMSSEEEKKKIKHKAKLEHKQSKLRQQNSLQLHNVPAAATAGTGPGGTSSLTRSDSTHSVSTSHSTVSSPPPPSNSVAPTPPPPPPLLPTLLPSPNDTNSNGNQRIVPAAAERSTFLNSISNFNKSALRKVPLGD